MIIIILGRESCIKWILRISNNEMLALTLLRSSAKLYSGSGMTISFCVCDFPLLGAGVAGGGFYIGGPLDLVL